MSICTCCKRKKYWLFNKDNGNCGLKEPMIMTNGITGKPMTVMPDYSFKSMKCCDMEAK